MSNQNVMTMLPEVTQKTLENHYAAIQAFDLEAWVGTFAEDGQLYDPVGTPSITGHTELAQFFQKMFSQFENVEVNKDSMFVLGNQAAVKWTAAGITKSDRQFKIEGIDVFHVNDSGKIQTLLAYWNPETLKKQL
jgi:steroid delta-isomerase